MFENPTCIQCGKPLTGRKVWWLNFDATTHTPIAPFQGPEHGDWGFHPIGSDCARKLGVPRKWLVADLQDEFLADAEAGR